MKSELKLAAIDLGAESGRVILVTISPNGVILDEVHRFINRPVRILNSLHWDILFLFSEIKHGLKLCVQKAGHLDGLGLDTWGVDFGLLDRDDKLLGNPYHYRDARTDGMLEKAFKKVTKMEIFQRTGIQFMQINSLFQLLSMQGSAYLEAARTFLTIPDLLNFWLSGEKVCEFSNATTTQMYDQRAHDWAYGLLNSLEIPKTIFPAVVQPGTILGNLIPNIAEEIGLEKVPVIVPACHDTGSAVAAVPAVSKRFAYISSGTWSLVGVEAQAPIINDDCLAFNFTNEGGVFGTVRLLKNVTGLWLVQECRRAWERAGESYTYAELTQMAVKAKPFAALLDPDVVDFLHPEDMPAAIRSYCVNTGQPIPETKEAILRCIFESLALKYRFVLERLEKLTGHPIDVVHIIGGGSQNEFLNQLTADAAQKPVIAGPVEATALGNAMVQGVSLGFFSNIQAARQLVAKQTPLKQFEPHTGSNWDEAYQKLLDLAKQSG